MRSYRIGRALLSSIPTCNQPLGSVNSVSPICISRKYRSRRQDQARVNPTASIRKLTVSAAKFKDHSMAHQTFPQDIPAPKDDGAYDHINSHYTLPSVALPVARDPSRTIDISQQDGITVVFCYPRTARPDETVPDEWNAIPGARGCTPQACSFRDNFNELRKLGVSHVYGISTQSPSYQAEVHERLHLPYDLLSDEHLEFQKALDLPTFDWQGGKVLRRSSIAVKDGKVLKSFYPVFPPDRGVQDVIEWLKTQ